jgi:hypothetical protein
MTTRTWPRIPLTQEERVALLRLCYLVRRGLLGPRNPALYARLTALLAA